MLYMVLLGGNHPKAKIEVHDIVFINSDDIRKSHEQLREMWFGDKSRVHIDSWMEVHGVDGYRVELSSTPAKESDRRLFFVNLGGYESSQFGEEHRYVLVVAENEDEAKLRAKQKSPNLWDKAHKDNLFDVDDCLRLDEVDGLYIQLKKEAHKPNVFKNDYTRL